MHYRTYLARHRLLYLRYTLLALLLVLAFFGMQVVLVLKEFQPQFAIVPSVLGLLIGLLLSSVMALRADLQQRNRLFRAVADFAQEFTYFRLTDGRYQYVSPACEKLTGHPPAAFYAQPNFMDQLIHPDDQPHWQHHVHRMNTIGEPEEILVRLRHCDGTERWISHLCSDVRDEQGRLLGVRSTNLDVSERIDYQRQLQQLADYDPLTALPNRRRLMQELTRLTQTGSHAPFTVLFLDLDHFKHINDTHGHTFGDRLLVALAERMRQHCCAQTLVARFGGDEFVVVVPDLNSADAASRFAQTLLQAIEQPFEIQNQRLFVSGSIGIALYPHDGNQPDELIRCADVAMYRAKLDGRATIGFYSRELVENAADFLDLETRLRDGLERGAFELHYQPRIRLSDGAVIGVEALARWPGNDESVSPARFIAVAEECGLIDRLTEQLLHQAAAQARLWPQLRVSFNLSGRQMRRPDLCDWLHGIITAAGSHAAQFELELTENVLFDAGQEAVLRLSGFRRLGYRIALDDFGTGFSSLAYLRDLPLDLIKLDGSFVRGMHDNSKDRAVVRAVVILCQEAGIDLVAEGIETEEQLAEVRALGVTEGQGYLLARPQPAATLLPLLQQSRLLSSQAKTLTPLTS